MPVRAGRLGRGYSRRAISNFRIPSCYHFILYPCLPHPPGRASGPSPSQYLGPCFHSSSPRPTLSVLFPRRPPLLLPLLAFPLPPPPALVSCTRWPPAEFRLPFWLLSFRPPCRRIFETGNFDYVISLPALARESMVLRRRRPRDLAPRQDPRALRFSVACVGLWVIRGAALVLEKGLENRNG